MVKDRIRRCLLREFGLCFLIVGKDSVVKFPCANTYLNSCRACADENVLLMRMFCIGRLEVVQIRI